MTCYICDKPATRRVTVEKTDPRDNLQYQCCEDCEPIHIPQGDAIIIRTKPIK